MSYKLTTEYKQLKKFEADYENMLMKEIYEKHKDTQKA